MDLVLWILGVVAASGVGLSLWLLRDRDRLRAAVIRARGEAELARARVADEETARIRFQAMAGDALKSSNEEFLKLAQEVLAARENRTLGEMEKRKDRIDSLVQPIQEALERTRQELGKVQKGHVGLGVQVEEMQRASHSLREETGKLAQALRKPNVRGRYGEIQLARVAELAGMRAYCDFTTQENLRDEEGQLLKPDMVVRLPNDRVVAVDAKTSIDSYLEALDATTDEEVEAHLERYADNVLLQAQRLSRKEYWTQFDDSPELVVMFIPSDQLVDAALERRPKLLDVAAERNIVIASPSTLIGLLRAVYVGWRERKLSDSAQELFILGRELHERAAVALSHAARVGETLDKARDSYNKFVASVDSRLVPTLRKFEERGARSPKEIPRQKPIEAPIQELQSMPPAPRGAPDEERLFEEPSAGGRSSSA